MELVSLAIRATTSLTAAVLLCVLVVLLVSPTARRRFIVMPMLVAVLQIPMALAILASSHHPTPRYPLPLLAFLVLILGLGLANIGRRWLTSTVLAVLLMQLVVAQLLAFGYLPQESDDPDLRPLRTMPGREAALIDAISEIGADADEEIVLATSGLGIYSLQVKYQAETHSISTQP